MFSHTIRSGYELKILEECHAPVLFAVVDQERQHLREWLAWVDSTNAIEDTLTFIRSTLEQFSTNYGFAAGIWNGERLAGTIGLHRIDWINQRVELGYWLAREFEGRGLMTDACKAVINHCFHGLGLNRVEIRCAAKNTKSGAIPQRLGFTLDATLPEAHFVNGRFHDLLIYGMLRRNWNH